MPSVLIDSIEIRNVLTQDNVTETIVNDSTIALSPNKKEKEPALPRIERINHFLELNAVIWDRDSHGLYDYDSKVLKESKLQMMGSA